MTNLILYEQVRSRLASSDTIPSMLCSCTNALEKVRSAITTLFESYEITWQTKLENEKSQNNTLNYLIFRIKTTEANEISVQIFFAENQGAQIGFQSGATTFYQELKPNEKVESLIL